MTKRKTKLQPVPELPPETIKFSLKLMKVFIDLMVLENLNFHDAKEFILKNIMENLKTDRETAEKYWLACRVSFYKLSDEGSEG